MDNNQHDIVRHEVVPPSKPVVIEDHVWIGSHVIILPGVRIGRNSAIGAGSVVTKDIPPHCLAVGNPARVVRNLIETLGGDNQVANPPPTVPSIDLP